jgi:hypothetical protein
LSAELVPLNPAPTPAVPAVQATDMYAALLSDARKETTRPGRDQVVGDLTDFLGLGDRSAACSLFVGGRLRSGRWRLPSQPDTRAEPTPDGI